MPLPESHLASNVRPRLRRSRHLWLKTFAGYSRLLACVTLIGSGLLQAELVERELGENLRYVRARILPTDLPSAELKSGPLVLDLRYTAAEPQAATALNAWLAFRATHRTPIFVLINPETASVLLNLFANVRARPNVLTIGRNSSESTADVGVTFTPEEERLAYDALSPTTSIDTLINENVGKARVDEASMLRERAEKSEPRTADNPDASTTEDAKKPDPPVPPLVDRPLQRAVHLHRAMLALKRL